MGRRHQVGFTVQLLFCLLILHNAQISTCQEHPENGLASTAQNLDESTAVLNNAQEQEVGEAFSESTHPLHVASNKSTAANEESSASTASSEAPETSTDSDIDPDIIETAREDNTIDRPFTEHSKDSINEIDTLAETQNNLSRETDTPDHADMGADNGDEESTPNLEEGEPENMEVSTMEDSRQKESGIEILESSPIAERGDTERIEQYEDSHIQVGDQRDPVANTEDNLVGNKSNTGTDKEDLLRDAAPVQEDREEGSASGDDIGDVDGVQDDARTERVEQNHEGDAGGLGDSGTVVEDSPLGDEFNSGTENEDVPRGTSPALEDKGEGSPSDDYLQEDTNTDRDDQGIDHSAHDKARADWDEIIDFDKEEIDPLAVADTDSLPPTIDNSMAADAEVSVEGNSGSPPEGSLASFFEKVKEKNEILDGATTEETMVSSTSMTSFESLAAQQKALGGEFVKEAPQEAPAPQYRGLPWGTANSIPRRRVPDMDLLYSMFRDRVLEELGMPTHESHEASHFPLGMGSGIEDMDLVADEALRSLFGSPNDPWNIAEDLSPSQAIEEDEHEFGDKLDGIDKLFQGVSPPEGLDVGDASGSSMQELLLETGREIVMKRLRKGLKATGRLAKTVQSKAHEKIRTLFQDDRKDGSTFSQEEATKRGGRDWKAAMQKVWIQSRAVFRSVAEFVSSFMEDDSGEDANLEEEFDLESIRRLKTMNFDQ